MGAKRHLSGTSQKGTYRQTHTQTHGHRDSMTESAQKVDSVKIAIARAAVLAPG